MTTARLRVLLIDDDPKMVTLVRGILTEEGYDVTGLTSADDIVAEANGADPDVVVLDQMMPGREGLEVAEELRESRPTQPIVIFSSLFDRRLSEETRRRGYVYCEKADGVDRLEEAIREAVSRGTPTR